MNKLSKPRCINFNSNHFQTFAAVWYGDILDLIFLSESLLVQLMSGGILSLGSFLVHSTFTSV